MLQQKKVESIFKDKSNIKENQISKALITVCNSFANFHLCPEETVFVTESNWDLKPKFPGKVGDYEPHKVWNA